MSALCKTFIRHLTFAVVLLLAGCAKGDVLCPTPGDAYGDRYLMLNISSRTQTRAGGHPYGGEDGDGREWGRNSEDEINDVTLFFYHADGVGADASTPVKFAVYIDGLNISPTVGINSTLPVQISGYEPEEGDRVIVFANMGDRTDLSTLEDVRDALVDQAWTADETGDVRRFRHFAMSSASDNNNNGPVHVDGHTGAYNDPFTASASLERVAARIDFWLIRQSESEDAPVEYETLDGSGTLRLSHIRIVNASDMPAYSLKRTSPSVRSAIGDVAYLGDETVLPGTHIPSNYVVEPLTHRKFDDASASDDLLHEWYGASSLDHACTAGFLSDEYKIHGCASDEAVFSVRESADVDGDGYSEGNMLCYTLGYTMENTMDVSGQQHRFMTGLALKGTFVPKNVYTMSGAEPEKDDSYQTGDDIWLYRNLETASGSRYFSSEEAVHAFEASQPAVTHDIVYYENAECYYFIWIRHAIFDSPDHPTGTYPMEYGIVRNNIYRIGVKSVTTIGTPEPDAAAPEPMMHSRIYVRKWRYREESEIVL